MDNIGYRTTAKYETELHEYMQICGKAIEQNIDLKSVLAEAITKADRGDDDWEEWKRRANKILEAR